MQKPQMNFKIDYTLLCIIFLLACMSFFSLYTITPILPEKYAIINFPLLQLRWYIIGCMIIFFTMLIDYDRFRKITWMIYTLGLIPLVMIFLRFPAPLMEEFNNIIRGIRLPIIGAIQPAEFMKIILIMVLSHIIASHHEKYTERTIETDLRLLIKIALVSALPMGLIVIQPDLGSTLVLIFIVCSLVLVSGIQWRIIFSVILSGIASIGLLVLVWAISPGPVATFLEESVFKHVTSRFYGWLNPEQYLDSGYQLVLTMNAIGSGQLFGKGMNNMEVYVPERHTDMIFTSIAEQFGFFGSSIVIIALFLLIYRLIHIALLSNDKYGSYLVTGLIGMFAYQIFQNIGMSIQLLPITGIPLPFISYGGSSILTNMLAVAIALNVHSRTKKYLFEGDSTNLLS